MRTWSALIDVLDAYLPARQQLITGLKQALAPP
jgi:hypothetical protein